MSSVVQISKIQVRRGLDQDLPALDSGEFGWSLDTQKLYIGNGTLAEGAPQTGVTEILTADSTVAFSDRLVLVENAVGTTKTTSLLAASSGTITSFTANNAVVTYTLSQSTKQRTGVIKLARYTSTTRYDDEYDETGATNLVFAVSANSTHSSLTYTTTTATTLLYRITSLP